MLRTAKQVRLIHAGPSRQALEASITELAEAINAKTQHRWVGRTVRYTVNFR